MTIVEWFTKSFLGQTLLLVITAMSIVGIIGLVADDKPTIKVDPCDCINVLNVPTQKVGIGMPIPIGHMSDADFKKYESCYKHYTSHWGAMKKCGDF